MIRSTACALSALLVLAAASPAAGGRPEPAVAAGSVTCTSPMPVQPIESPLRRRGTISFTRSTPIA